MGQIATQEMYRVFNMGIGMVIVVDSQHLETLRQAIPEEVFQIGELVSGKKEVTLV
jgi:phosphoribosylformylglycinamidine cyclo-ligase